MLDANNAWESLPSALDVLRPMLAHRPYFIEEPFGPDDLDNHRRLAEALAVPIATGELVGGRWGHRALMDQGGITVLQPDAAVCGGITEFRRIAAAAASFGVSVAPHSFQDIHAHLVASTPNALFLEYFTDGSIVPIGRALTSRIEVRDGAAILPDAPGLGFDFDEDVVRAHSADGWA
jgi:L-alanine-DL-glutamate epimerase-like enolase superfamily enzyme